MAPPKTSPWAGLSEMTAVASTVDARSKVSAPEGVICPEGVTVTGKAEALFTTRLAHSTGQSPGRHTPQTPVQGPEETRDPLHLGGDPLSATPCSHLNGLVGKQTVKRKPAALCSPVAWRCPTPPACAAGPPLQVRGHSLRGHPAQVLTADALSPGAALPHSVNPCCPFCASNTDSPSILPSARQLGQCSRGCPAKEELLWVRFIRNTCGHTQRGPRR